MAKSTLMEWSREELQTLRDEAHHGAAHLSAKLGRSVKAIRRKAEYMRISLRVRGSRRGALMGQPRGVKVTKHARLSIMRGILSLDPDDPLELCPHCGRHYVHEFDGVCTTTRVKAKLEAYVADHREDQADARPFITEYNRQKKQEQRRREAMLDDWEPDW